MIYELLTIGALIQPPARFDHEYRGKREIIWVNSDNIGEYCESGVACVIYARPWHCKIVFNVAYIIEYPEIMRHEFAHCNGWPSDHPP